MSGGMEKKLRHWKKRLMIGTLLTSLTPSYSVRHFVYSGLCNFQYNYICIIGCPRPEKEHVDLLKKKFGHSKFKPSVDYYAFGGLLCMCIYMYLCCSEQWRIIYSLLFHRRDNCAVLATGINIVQCTCITH